ncbi:MAG: 4Fe-4S binding protein [Candidatus Omnitrophica bacterium]|nr:4Fe-4S binding protein [Candidatus Omnitrophota bacterium]
MYFKINGLLALETLINSGKFFIFLLPGFIMILLIIIAGNFFCFWLCPLGGSIDYLNLLVFRRLWKVSFTSPKILRKTSLWILIFVLASSLSTLIFSFPYTGFIFDPFVILGQAMTGVKLWVVFLSIIVLSSVLFPRLWCNYVCPLGRFYTLTGNILKKRKKGE